MNIGRTTSFFGCFLVGFLMSKIIFNILMFFLPPKSTKHLSIRKQKASWFSHGCTTKNTCIFYIVIKLKSLVIQWTTKCIFFAFQAFLFFLLHQMQQNIANPQIKFVPDYGYFYFIYLLISIFSFLVCSCLLIKSMLLVL